jgi:hypothetical protein
MSDVSVQTILQKFRYQQAEPMIPLFHQRRISLAAIIAACIERAAQRADGARIGWAVRDVGRLEVIAADDTLLLASR